MTEPQFKLTPRQEQILAFSRNMCVVAGAGTGKTMTLVGLILKLLDPEGGRGGLDLTSILALTYTEKATREMRDRLRQALNLKAKTAEDAWRPFWKRQRRLLDRASISTIHSFSLQVLREFNLEAGIDPDFAVLDDSRDFTNRVRREALLDWVQQQEPDFLDLLEYFPWMTRGRGWGMDKLLAAIYGHSRCFGRQAESAETDPVPADPQAQKLLEAADLIEKMIEQGAIPSDKKYFFVVRGFSEAVRRLLRPGLTDDEIFSALPELQAKLTGNWYKAGQAKDIASAAIAALAGERDRRASLKLKEKLARLADKMGKIEDQARTSRSVMDFDDLLLKTRGLLAENPAVRSILKQRYQVVLVDEFQDTNRLQADIIAYLVEPEEEAEPRPAETPAMEVLKKGERRLVVFGDPKQSIYRFRGAEVSVFERLRKSIAQTGSDTGSVSALDKNFRSQKNLVEFYNAFFPEHMPPGPDFASHYSPDDHQEWDKKDLGSGPNAVLLKISPIEGGEAAQRRKEAEVLAGYLTDLLQGRTEVLVGKEGRKPEPKDAAVLLRRFTYLKEYEDAFRRAGLDYYTIRGRGFYQCPEVWDLINLLLFLGNPEQGPALLGLLRSPLVGLDDETLTRLVWPGPGALRRELHSYFIGGETHWPPGLDEGRKQKLEYSRNLLSRLCAMAGRAFPAELVEYGIEASDYLAVVLAQHQGVQKAANVQRFLEIVRRLPLEALYSPAETAAFFQARLEDEQDDPEATTAEGVQAVQIMTIHQAKGLQFPVVLVPDAGNVFKKERRALIFGPEDRFALAFNDPVTRDRRIPGDYEDFKHDNDTRERAEYVRLLYVAATRAQDHLVFSGTASTGRPKDCWLTWLNDFAAQRPDLLECRGDEPQIRMDTNPAGGLSVDSMQENDKTPTLESLDQPVLEIFKRTLDKKPAAPRYLTLSVTDLSKYLECPRLFYLEHLAGLPLEQSWIVDVANGKKMGSREKGIILHHILETIELDPPPDLGTLTRAARRFAEMEGWPADEDVLGEAAAAALNFFESRWGRDLFRSTGGFIRREMPVWLRIDPEDETGPVLILTGEIDLFYVTPEGLARVVDYKFALADNLKLIRYEPQIKAYALALMRAGFSKKIEAGLYFAGGGAPECLEVPLPQDWQTEFTAVLQKTAAQLSRIVGPDHEAPEPLKECELPHCALKYACTK